MYLTVYFFDKYHICDKFHQNIEDAKTKGGQVLDEFKIVLKSFVCVNLSTQL